MIIPLVICLSAGPASLAEDAVDQLQEYRSALTGKIDVRGTTASE